MLFTKLSANCQLFCRATNVYTKHLLAYEALQSSIDHAKQDFCRDEPIG